MEYLTYFITIRDGERNQYNIMILHKENSYCFTQNPFPWFIKQRKI
jgi:hypothetical protein